MLVAHNFGQDPKFYEGLTRSLDWIATQADLPRVLAKAKQKNIGVTVMKTQHGARLNDMRPYETGGATFSQAALRWVMTNPHVDAAVITMSSAERVNEYLGASGYRELAAGDRNLLERYAQGDRFELLRERLQRLRERMPLRRAHRRRAENANVRGGLRRHDHGARRVRPARDQRGGVPVVQRRALRERVYPWPRHRQAVRPDPPVARLVRRPGVR